MNQDDEQEDLIDGVISAERPQDYRIDELNPIRNPEDHEERIREHQKRVSKRLKSESSYNQPSH